SRKRTISMSSSRLASAMNTRYLNENEHPSLTYALGLNVARFMAIPPVVAKGAKRTLLTRRSAVVQEILVTSVQVAVQLGLRCRRAGLAAAHVREGRMLEEPLERRALLGRERAVR